LGQLSRQNKKIIGKAVEVQEGKRVQGALKVERDRRAFGAATYGAANVTEGYRGVTARQDEVFERRQGGFHAIHLRFEQFGIGRPQIGGVQLFIGVGGHVRAEVEQAVLGTGQNAARLFIGNGVAQPPDKGIQFVKGTVGIHAQVVFGHSAPAEQSRLALIAGFGVDFECHFQVAGCGVAGYRVTGYKVTGLQVVGLQVTGLRTMDWDKTLISSPIVGVI
jgi:hypothetical protein